MKATKERQPGDLILDRYMPNAPYEEREAARKNLEALVLVLLRIDERLHREAVEKASRGNGNGEVESEGGLRGPPL